MFMSLAGIECCTRTVLSACISSKTALYGHNVPTLLPTFLLKTGMLVIQHFFL